MVRKNPPKGTKQKISFCTNDPKLIKPSQRCAEFSDAPLTVSGGKLVCTACREELSLKRSIIKNHVQSMKHKIVKKSNPRKNTGQDNHRVTKSI